MIGKSPGFTIMEVLISVAITALLAVAIGDILIQGFRHNEVIWEQLKTQAEGRRVLEQVVNYARKAETSSVGGYPIVSSTPNQFIFYANIDEDNYKEQVRFFLDGTTLKRGIIKPGGNPLVYDSGSEVVTTLAYDVVNIAEGIPVFRYYDESYSGTEDALDDPVDVTAVRVVRVSLELERAPTASPEPLYVESVVHVRNVKGN